MFSKATYKPLSEGEGEADADPVDKEALLPKVQSLTILQQSKTRSIGFIHLAIVGSELVLLAILLAGYVGLKHGSQPSQDSLDGLSYLTTSYNTTMTFHNQSHLLRASSEADSYWARLLESGGVVSLDTQWAHAQGLRKSAISPTDPSQSIYQVDVFHALHCMNAIRQNLMSKTPPPWDEVHMLHCLDYIRHELLCHPDLTLVSTNNLEEFVLDETHTCKDYGAALGWVERHRWKEFPDWIRNKSKSGP